MISTRARLAVLDAATRAVPGVPFEVVLDADERADDVAAWVAGRGLRVASVEAQADGRVLHRLRTGRAGDPLDDLPPDRRPGARLWIYTNFHCNLACDYCCVSSSPRAPRRAVPVETVERAASEARALGTTQIFLTGGEPFLRSDISELVATCAAASATTVLTNGMLFGGSRRAWLDACPRDGVTLQVSLDSAGPALHDRHRGTGSHAAALAGIRTALELGFRVRVAATLGPGDHDEEQPLHAVCDGLGVSADDRVIRRIALQGNAVAGVRISRASIIPEICVTDRDVAWHPVGANDPELRVCDGLPPLADVVAAVRDEFREHRLRNDEIAASFPCG